MFSILLGFFVSLFQYGSFYIENLPIIQFCTQSYSCNATLINILGNSKIMGLFRYAMMSMTNVLGFEKLRPATKLTKLMQEGLEITSIRTMPTGPHVSLLKH